MVAWRSRLLLSVLCMAGALALWAGAARATSSDEAIPRALVDWEGWVMKGYEFRRCPFLGGGDNPPDESAYRCVWPERLQLAVDAHGGHFTQRWQVYAESWVALPGDLVHWPDAVVLDGRPAPVVARAGVPSLRLSAGLHEVSGSWQWDVRPETLSIPQDTALLSLSVDGVPIAEPERPDGQVVLGRQKSTVEPRSLDLQVYRLLEYDEPVRLSTRLRLRVAGDAREESLGTVLPQGFVPLSLQSPLPARLDADGTLRVEVRPGDFELSLVARQAAGAVYRIPTGSLVRQEVWSFAANDRLGVATVEGAPNVDPSQAQVPEEWRSDPAFVLDANTRLRLIEHSRGMSEASQNRLRLQREMWLDFDHQGWTVRDQISGTLRHTWRLDLQAPYELGSAREGEHTLLVTSGQNAGTRGVELRTPQLALTAISRVPHPFGELPATGWAQSFESVSGLLHLPPGHRLIAVLGADESPTAWINRWGLWNLFGVLVVVVLARWQAGWRVAAIGALALLATCQEEPLLVLFWANLIAAVALAHAARGRLVRWAQGYRIVSLVVLLLALVPFGVTELRDAIYPQLASSAQEIEGGGTIGTTAASAAAPVFEPSAQPPPPPALAAGLPAPLGFSSSGSLHGLMSSTRVPEERLVSGAPAATAGYNYAPGANVQAGPGVPSWSYETYRFSWSGPVDPGQTVRFIVLGPVAVGIWRIAGVVLLALFLLRLLRVGSGPGPQAVRAAASALVLLFLVPVGHAQPLPNQSMLRELQQRLTEPPRCAPTCAELLSAQIHLNGARITAQLRASALALVAVALPSAADHWQIDTVMVDGVSSLTVHRETDGGWWVPLEPGVHDVRVEGHVTGASLHLVFPMPPRQITVDASGWRISGISAGRLLAGALDLTRQQPARTDMLGTGSDSQEFPSFVRVVRQIDLGLQWSITSRVERVSPSSAAFTVAVPLIPGESVLTGGLRVNPDGTLLVGLAAGEDARQWSSSLPRAQTLSLHLPVLPARSEVWRFVVSPQWHVEFRGLPAILPDNPDAAPWVFEYRPRPGEGLDLTVTQPPAVAGATLAIEHVRHVIEVGHRSANETLALIYRSTQGGSETFSLPSDASVTRVAVDGSPVPLRPQRGQLALSVLPGEHSIDIAWRSPRGEAVAIRPDAVALHAPATNVDTTLILPEDRWPLFAAGAGVGPAFLYWGELVIFVVVAIVLARSKRTPLSFLEWLLLGFGLSTLSWLVLSLVAVWLLVMSWRESTALVLSLRQFNALQVLLVLLTAVAVLSLVFFGIRYGLLARPDMGVKGPGSGAGTFTWFTDHTSSLLPRPTVYSVPMWVYRAVMFAWALWIALALARWLRFAWRAWNTGGCWRTPGGDADHQAAA